MAKFLVIDSNGQVKQGSGDDPISGADLALVFPVTLTPSPLGGVSEVEKFDLPGYELPDGDDSKGVSFLFVLTDQINLSSNPNIRFEILVLDTGSGDDDAYFELVAKYISPSLGEGSGKAVDETLNIALPITDVEGQMHELIFDLDKSLITSLDKIFIVMKRLGSHANDDFEGKLMVATQGGLEFGT